MRQNVLKQENKQKGHCFWKTKSQELFLNSLVGISQYSACPDNLGLTFIYLQKYINSNNLFMISFSLATFGKRIIRN